MDKILQFQMSLFGSFDNIQPNMELTMKIAENLKSDGFVPGTITINTIQADSMKSELHLKMVSANQEWAIVFLSDRIDINYNYLDGVLSYTSVRDIVERAKDLCAKSFGPIAGTTGSRLAINGKFLLTCMGDEERMAYLQKYVRYPEVYNGKPLIEWNVHYNSLTDIEIRTGLEKCNYIINITDVYLNNATEDVRTIVAIDINTSALNAEFKYLFNDLLDFSDKACVLAEKALQEVEGE